MTIDQVAAELAKRLTRIFLKNSEGERQVNALYPRFQKDENFRDYVPFYEYFDGDTARGVGFSPDRMDRDRRQDATASRRLSIASKLNQPLYQPRGPDRVSSFICHCTANVPSRDRVVTTGSSPTLPSTW